MKSLGNSQKIKIVNNGDITVKEYVDIKEEAIGSGDRTDNEITSQASSTLQDRTATFTRTVDILGVPVLETTSRVTYTHDGTQVTRIISYNHIISRNLIVTTDGDISGQTAYISSDKRTAYSSAEIQFSLIWDELGMVIQSGQLVVWGNVNNQAGGWVTAY